MDGGRVGLETFNSVLVGVDRSASAGFWEMGMRLGIDTLLSASSFGSERDKCRVVTVCDGESIGDWSVVNSKLGCDVFCSLLSSEVGDLLGDSCVCSIDSESLSGCRCSVASGGGGVPGDDDLVAKDTECGEPIVFVNVELVS